MNALLSVRVQAEGQNHARLLNALRTQGVAVRSVSRRGAKIAFRIDKKDLHKTFAILQDMCYTDNSASVSRIGALGKAALRRVGFFVGVALFSLLLAFTRGYVWRVEIAGNDRVPRKVIENVLQEHNIAVGKRAGRFDGDALSAAVRAIDGVSLATVTKTGTTVRVEVFEGERTSPPLAGSDTDILSRYNATVTRLVVREGTAKVRVGQNVAAGTPLIGAYRTVQEGVTAPCKASGLVYGTVTFPYERTLCTDRYEYVPVKTKRYTRLRIFGLTIGKKPKTGQYTRIRETRAKFDTFLPVTVLTTRVTSLRAVKKSASIEELTAKAEQEALAQFIHDEVSNGFSVHSSVRALGANTYKIHVFVEAEMLIGSV